MDLTRRSFTYESRLIKYAKREYCVGIPGLDLGNVDLLRIQKPNESISCLFPLFDNF